MKQTPTYHLNQWDAEDRILRTDFNADNTKLEAALIQGGQNLSSAAAQWSAALQQEQQARTTADASIRQDFSAADASVRQDFSAADTSVRQDLSAAITQLDGKTAAALSAEQGTRAQQDAAIRQEFAAADAAISGANRLVKLAEITTSANAAQVDLSLAGFHRPSYASLMIIPQLNATCDYIMVRVNSVSSSLYFGNPNENRFGDIYSYSQGACSVCNLYMSETCFAMRIQNDGCHDGRSINSEVSSRGFYTGNTPAATLQTLNFITNNASAIFAGSKIFVYGVKL